MTHIAPDTERAASPAESEQHARVDVVARHKRLVFRTVLVSALTLASRIIGFFRESLSASIFGDSSAVNDAFVTAWRIPNLFRALLGEGAISTAMQTAITRADADHGLAAGRRLFQAIFRVVGWLALATCAIGMLVVYVLPDTMPFTGWHWLGDTPGPVRELTFRMLPFVVLVCLSAVCGGALQVRGHFFAPSLAPAVMNCGWIAALYLVADRYGREPILGDAAAEYARQLDMARMLAWFVLVAGLILLCVQVPALVRERLFLRAHAPADERALAASSRREVWTILRASAPLAVGAAVYQINVMVDGWMAIGLLADGGPSLLYYATRIQQFPMSLVSIAATNAVFPALTALGHKRELARVRTLHDDTHLAIAFVAVPATIGLFAFAEPIVAVCFEHGAFGNAGVLRASAGLRCLTLAILPAGAAGLVARTYYALGDFKTPVKISLALMFVNVALNIAFVAGFGMDLDGLALATAVVSWLNLALLLPGLSRRLGLPAHSHGLWARVARIVVAATVSVVAARALYALLGPERAAARPLALSIASSVALYCALAHVLRIPEWRHLLARGRRDSPTLP